MRRQGPRTQNQTAGGPNPGRPFSTARQVNGRCWERTSAAASPLSTPASRHAESATAAAERLVVGLGADRVGVAVDGHRRAIVEGDHLAGQLLVDGRPLRRHPLVVDGDALGVGMTARPDTPTREQQDQQPHQREGWRETAIRAALFWPRPITACLPGRCGDRPFLATRRSLRRGWSLPASRTPGSGGSSRSSLRGTARRRCRRCAAPGPPAP